jgi:predicted GNAT superfamily acetyltransferase
MAHTPGGIVEPANMLNVTLADGTVIRELASHDERFEAVRIQDETWGPTFTERVPSAILLVAQKTGGVCAGAFSPDGRLLGFVFGMTGIRDGHLIHWSDMLAVRAEAQGQHLGEALKHYQRDRCREAGIETMYWTFDPLVARNAHLNLNRLGASIEEFVPDMYGAHTSSPLHAFGTDRFVAAWNMQAALVPLPSEPSLLAGAPVVADAGAKAEAVSPALPDVPAVAVRIPADYHALLGVDAERAHAWRKATRRAFQHYFSRGYRVTAFVTGSGHATYLLSRTD